MHEREEREYETDHSGSEMVARKDTEKKKRKGYEGADTDRRKR